MISFVRNIHVHKFDKLSGGDKISMKGWKIYGMYRAKQLLAGLDFFDHVLSWETLSDQRKNERETKIWRSSMNTKTKLKLCF